MNKKVSLLFAVVGFVWIAIGLRDFFTPHLFRFDGRVATTSTIVLNLAVGAIFLLATFSFHHHTKGRDSHTKPDLYS